MGKISDALEKADKQPGKKEASKPRTPAKKKQKDAINPNIVPIATFKRTMSGRQGIDKKMVVLHAPQSLESEAIKVLRTNLLFPASGIRPKSILVTSAIPGDGKSFLSANLAISIAQGIEDHVLLIDADIRKSSIEKIFGYENKRGLSEYLTEGSDIGDYLCKTPISKLNILPAGKLPSNPTELLTTQKLQKLLVEVAGRYRDRYVIIDTAPPSLAPETAAISKFVDGVILVVKAGKTPRSAVTEVIEHFGKEKFLGVVLNHSDQSMKKYYGNGKYYHK